MNNTHTPTSVATIGTRFTYNGYMFTVIGIGDCYITAHRDGAEYDTIFNGLAIPQDSEMLGIVNKTTHPQFYKN